MLSGGSPGLVVMGRDSRCKGIGFESWHRVLDGHFFTYICCKNCTDVCLKRPKMNEKVAGVGPYFKKTNALCLVGSSRGTVDRATVVKIWTVCLKRRK